MKRFTITQFFAHIFIISLLYSCSKQDVSLPESWRKEPTLNEHLRFGAQVFESEDHIFLLPGKGGSRFSRVPEIMRFNGETWSYEDEHPRSASAGGSGYWQIDGVGYLVGGSQYNGFPTSELVKLDVSNSYYNSLNGIPLGSVFIYGSANTETKGYINVFDRSDGSPYLYSYDFLDNSWNALTIPYDSMTSTTVLETVGDSLFILRPNQSSNNFSVYQESENQLMSLPDFPGDVRPRPIFKRYNDYLIYGGGDFMVDLWKFDLDSLEWQRMSDFPGTPFSRGFYFILNDRFYLGGGITNSLITPEVLNNEVWSFSLSD